MRAKPEMRTCPVCSGTGTAPLGISHPDGGWIDDCYRCRGEGEVQVRAARKRPDLWHEFLLENGEVIEVRS